MMLELELYSYSRLRLSYGYIQYRVVVYINSVARTRIYPELDYWVDATYKLQICSLSVKFSLTYTAQFYISQMLQFCSVTAHAANLQLCAFIHYSYRI